MCTGDLESSIRIIIQNSEKPQIITIHGYFMGNKCKDHNIAGECNIPNLVGWLKNILVITIFQIVYDGGKQWTRAAEKYETKVAVILARKV